MKSTLTQLTKISQSFFKKNKSEIKDIVVFGSLIRGKPEPKDIDILIIFKKKIDKDIEYELKKLLSIKNISIVSKTEETYQQPSFDAREGILFEGYSLINQKFIASDFGFISLGLFFYSTKELSNVEKTKFYYALNGRGKNKGMIINLEAIKLSDNLIAVPLNQIEKAKEFFEFWKLEFKYVPSLIPQRMGRKGIIGKKSF